MQSKVTWQYTTSCSMDQCGAVIALPPVTVHALYAGTTMALPASPFGPCGPVAPVSPFGPCGPVGPLAPCAPVSPFGPCGPVSPVAPVSPFGPCGPVAPVSPFGPCGPVAPVSPVSPFGPCGPGTSAWHTPSMGLLPHEQQHSGSGAAPAAAGVRIWQSKVKTLLVHP